jgi:hypothetical protein
MSTTKPSYTRADCGCYVDGANGIYATDAIIDFANMHGASIKHDPDCDGHGSTFGKCEWANEYEDEASDYLNAQFPVDDAYWGRNDNGDWGLWAIDDDM